MTFRILCLIGLLGLAACDTPHAADHRSSAAVTVEPPPPVPVAWRAVAQPADAARIDSLPARWDHALAGVRKWRLPAMAAEGALLQSNAALVRPMPPPGRYRCRYVRLSEKQGGLQLFKPWFCFVAEEGELTTFAKATGDERPAGRLWPDSDRRMIFLGAITRGADKSAPAYGDSPAVNAIGVLERVGDFQWRLVLLGNTESALDVIELVPDVPPVSAAPSMS